MAVRVFYDGKQLTEEGVLELLSNELSDLSESESEDVEFDFAKDKSDSSDEEISVAGPSNVQRQSNNNTDNFHVEWDRVGPSTFTNFQFDGANAGIQEKINDSNKPTEVDYFLHLFGGDIVQHIVDETNRYYAQIINSVVVTDSSKLTMWKDTNVGEMFCFLALLMLMSHVKKPSIKEYWSKDFLVSTPLFAHVMSQNRFLLILRCLHFCNNDDNNNNKNRLFKIEALLKHFNLVNAKVFKPFMNLCIDESLVLWKGRLIFRQYIPSKRARFGIKIFSICDCETGFCLGVIVYTGKDTQLLQCEHGLPTKVVMTLMEPYFDKGHKLFVDNWYTSLQLFNLLVGKKVNACGTIRRNRKGIPIDNKLKTGEMEVLYSDKYTYVHWVDRRDVRMLSSIHNDVVMLNTEKTDRKTGVPQKKPSCILDYNNNMGAVDQGDMQLSSLRTGRKSLKWYKKLFQHILDLSVRNAMILHQIQTGKKLSLEVFRLAVIRQLIGKFHVAKTKPKGGRPSSEEMPLRLSERHFPTIVPPTDKKKNAARVCRVCSNKKQGPKKRKESRYMCKSCDVGLCIVPCFEKYHTEQNY